jgi:capsular polysaccharide biosynthesis protein/Mrp family chromosome partitioning ATPase
MDSMSSSRQSTLDYGLLLRRRGWVVLCGVLIGLIFAYAYVTLTPKTFRSTALVLVKATEADRGAVAGGRTSAPVNLDTESQLVRSIVVATRAQKLLRSPLPPAELVSYLQVAVPANTSVISISYESNTATGALQGAHAFAEAYLQNRLEAAKAEVGIQVKSLQEQIAQRQKELEDWSGKAASLPATSSEGAYASAQERVILDQISELNRRLSPLVTADLDPGRIITDAQLPNRPSTPVPLLYLASGLMAGLLFGLIIAVVLERVDRRVLRAEELEHAYSLPVLLKLRGPRRREVPSAIPSPESHDGQEFHQLCHALTAKFASEGQVVLVTGASGGAATGLVAAGLATALARRGATVALVCADPSSPSVALFHAHGDRRESRKALGVGASAVEPAGQDTLAPYPSAPRANRDLPPLRVVAPGMSSEDLQAKLRESPGELFTSLRRSVRYVVVDAPAISVAADTLTLAEYADVALIVVEIPRSSRDEIRESVRRAVRVGLDIAGAAVVPSRVVKRQKAATGEEQDQVQELPPLPPDPIPPVPLNGVTRPAPTSSTADAVSEHV